jgi:hypothetical protein
MGNGNELTRREVILAAGASVVAFGAPGFSPASVRADPTSTRLDPTSTLLLRGIETSVGVLFAADIDNNTLLESSDWAGTWGAPNPLPPDTTADQATRLLIFADQLFCAARNGSTDSLAVYVSPFAAGDAPYTWTQTPLTAQPSTSAKSGTQFTCDAQYLYAGEYGDPPAGPNLYRSADGDDWATVFSRADQLRLIGRTARHIHAVAVDPYNAGHVYITTGDFGIATGAALWRSTQSADPGTWEVVLPTGRWQSSQISFDQNSIWLAADNHVDTAVVVDRATMTAQTAASTHHYQIPVPGGAPGDAYFRIASHGCVDQLTGIYYCVATTDVGNTQGMFAIPAIGAPVSLIDPGGIGIEMDEQVYIANGSVWSGQWYRPLLS